MILQREKSEQLKETSNLVAQHQEETAPMGKKWSDDVETQKPHWQKEMSNLVKENLEETSRIKEEFAQDLKREKVRCKLNKKSWLRALNNIRAVVIRLRLSWGTQLNRKVGEAAGLME